MQRLSLPLLVTAIMTPQLLETLYSPALTAIRSDFGVSAAQAGQTLSIYFFAFALGVAFWGAFCDRFGRRPAMLAGLALYLVGAGLALLSGSFTLLLAARALIAFGAAVGSIVTQTMLRDVYQGPALGRMFALVGIALSISPLLGMFAGGALVAWGGSAAIFTAQAAWALALLLWSYGTLPETRRRQTATAAAPGIALTAILRDRHIWCSALLVASFNIMVFSYFSLAPFMFERLGLKSQQFGYSGVMLALGSLAGALLNRHLLARGVSAKHQILLGGLLAVASGVALFWWQHSLWMLLPCALVMLAFGLAIPNVLSQALSRYRQQLGTAGALFGLLYYLLIGLGLTIAARGQDLAATLLLCGLLSLWCAGRLPAGAPELNPKAAR
ncbi:Inner membrane transport protein ydhC [Serratia marcescens]|uniref:MFS transporter n=1 Tax=Serratia marcescens TaxID=615 RepID=UPI00217B43F2|nr:MFS transporter [Serratia marcescens]CAI0794457.1 Inner membrane transport protein ydhC [Serratia marcescens]CAI0795526.1 Inner membrane transport protein ydhC [Serratia marcescens]HEB0051613.1 MFS transporter [Serratia marcescens]HEB0066822.1 MFS transporter [Serratia marcescens]HEB0071409.1 MFS transporter [Serratia marcescens]